MSDFDKDAAREWLEQNDYGPGCEDASMVHLDAALDRVIALEAENAALRAEMAEQWDAGYEAGYDDGLNDERL